MQACETSPDIEKAIIAAKEISKMIDVEARHIAFDELLIKIIRYHGYNEVAEIFENTIKWYA